jgi:aspartyl-tRNA(Asn)/glutamyl-tRNA(Gln) amidotransferase subunit C
MSLQREDVERIAHLARLAIAEEDIPRYARELSSILEFVRQMEAVVTEGVLPLAHPLDATQRLRLDQVTEGDQRERFQSLAPLAEEGLYLVPKVIE